MRKFDFVSTLSWPAVLFIIFGLTIPASGAEISLLSGIYQKEDYKADGKKVGGKSTITFGGRYGDDLDTDLAWFGQGLLVMNSYHGDGSPSNSTSLKLGGGVRWYLSRFSESVVPFLAGAGFYKNEKEVQSFNAMRYTEEERSGLYYGGTGGIRIGLSPDFFVDLETTFFESALFATEKETSVTTTQNATGQQTTTKDTVETAKTELYGKSDGVMFGTIISLGMKL